MWLSLCLLGTSACSQPSDVSDATEFYAGRTLRIVVPFSPGGGYDVQSRLLASHLGKHVPGNPTVIVENMPGAGGLVATKYLAHRARPDGLTLGMLSPSAVLAHLVGNEDVRFDIREFGFIGAPNTDVSVCGFSRASGIEDIKTWRTAAEPPRMGASGFGARSHAIAKIVSVALDLHVRLVTGYQGMSEIRHAIESGELEGVCTALTSFRAAFVPTGRYRIVVRVGDSVVDGLETVPLAKDLAGPDGRALLSAIRLIDAAGRYYAFPPQTPFSLVALMETAFLATMEDKEFLRAAEAARFDIRPTSGAEVARSVKRVLELPDDTKQKLMRALSPSP